MSAFSQIMKDIKEAFFDKRYVWLILSLTEIKTKYKRTIIGPFWMSIGTGIIVTGMGVIWGAIFHMSLSEFLPYIALGLIFWTFISSILAESCTTFISNSDIIHNTKLPLIIYVIILVSRNFIVLLHNMVVFILIFIACKQTLSLKNILFIPGLILLVLNTIWASLFISIMATRFRDITPVIAYSLMLIMMATPVVWRTDMLTGSHKLLADLNPLTHFLRIVRDPLLNLTPPLISYSVVSLVLIVGTFFTLWVYKNYMNRIIYWL